MFPIDYPTKQQLQHTTQPSYAQITRQPPEQLSNSNEQLIMNDLNEISYNYSQTDTQPSITNELLMQHNQQMEQMQYRLPKCNTNLFEDSPSESLDLGTFNSPKKPKHTKQKSKKIKKVKNTPSRWKKYYCDPPSTPSSTDNELDDNTINMFEIMKETNEKKSERSDDNLYNLWLNRINGEVSHEMDDEYNEITGGKCYEIEEKCKQLCLINNFKNNIYLSYLNNINKNNIFYLNASSIYENIFIYLDGKSIFNGIMITCKKLYYFKFMDQTLIWNDLLKRDFPKLYDNKYNLEIPYINTYSSFKDTILLRPNERHLYFNKIRNDKFWGLLFNLNLKNININTMNNNEIENKWNSNTIRWIDLFLGRNNDYGYYAYKQLIQLQSHLYIQSFNDNILPTNNEIEYFCLAIRKNMPSGISILYLSPWINPSRCIEWAKRKILWLNVYKQCWALSESDKYFYDEIHKLPNIIKLIGQIQFQNGKSFKPDPEWLPFLQTFDPNIKQYNQIKDGWFQKQFMLNEMENRLKNIRNLIEIVRQ